MKQTFTFFIALAIFSFTNLLSAQVRLQFVDPSSGMVGITNFGDSNVDISQHRLCHLFTYPVISSLTIVDGDPTNLGPGDMLLVAGVALNATASDLGLYLPTGAFSDPNSMLDFTQWGSSGNGRESVAVEKGIWEAGTFISDPGPYAYNGDGTQFGVEFWVTFVDGVKEYSIDNQINAFPNPVVNELNIVSDQLSFESIRIFNTLGALVFTQNLNTLQQTIKLDLSSLESGNYVLYLKTTDGLATKRISLIK